MKLRNIRKKMTVWQLLALGYFAVIITGAGLLSLPFASQAGENTSFINALFTSTSATCVTGLVPYDTATHWSRFGQIVILCLIQLGGLGFMTLVSLFFNLIGKNMGVYERKALMTSAGEDNRSELQRLLKRILLGTLLFEGLGALFLSFRFIGTLGTAKGIYYSVWHSVSAFCNAGFDLMGSVSGKFSSLSAFAKDPLVTLTIAGLIVMGGIGFCVWDDILTSRFRWKKYRLHTKAVLIMTTVLLTSSTLLYLLFERSNPLFTNYTFGDKLLVAFFNACTPRTAGFNVVEFGALSDSSYLLTVTLMFIGGSSGSTAGGVKVTTLFVIVMGISSVLRGKQDVEVGKRRVHNALLRQALAVFVSCLFFVIVATICLCAIEANNPAATFQTVLFETVSALATVGLSLSLTPTLSIASKIIIILLMYAGRVGILTVALAFAEQRSPAKIRKPVDTLLIG